MFLGEDDRGKRLFSHHLLRYFSSLNVVIVLLLPHHLFGCLFFRLRCSSSNGGYGQRHNRKYFRSHASLRSPYCNPTAATLSRLHSTISVFGSVVEQTDRRLLDGRFAFRTGSIILQSPLSYDPSVLDITLILFHTRVKHIQSRHISWCCFWFDTVFFSFNVYCEVI